MTPEEALRTCQVALDYIGAKYNKEAKTHKDFYEGLLAALKQRADIGLMATAIEKQIAKIPLDQRGRNPRRGVCPVCRDGSNSEFSYCGNCGQRLYWRDKNEAEKNDEFCSCGERRG